jgi:Cytochrome P460
MNFRLIVLIATGFTILAAGSSQPEVRKGPVFTNDGKLVLPSGFREWVFIGGPITPNGLNGGKAQFPEFHSVYVEPENFHYYQKHGNFPEGTVLVKELALTQPGKYPDGSLDTASGRGYFPSALHGFDVMVKDSKRFADTNNWGFFTFGHQVPPYEPTAKVMPSGQCAYCHIAGVAKTDMVWEQFYPLLHTKSQLSSGRPLSQ